MNAQVVNTGGDTNRSFKVSFYAGDAEKPFDEITLFGIDSNEIIDVDTTWNAEDVDRIRVVVDRDNPVSYTHLTLPTIYSV